jgi:hypothetical protein
MEINNTETLLRLIRSSSEEEAADLLKQYSDILKKDTIEYTWSRARVLVRHIAKNRRQRVRKEMINYDTESGMISLVQFTRFIAAIENVATVHYEKGDLEIKTVVADIVDQLYQSLGNVRIDKRIIFTKD